MLQVSLAKSNKIRVLARPKLRLKLFYRALYRSRGLSRRRASFLFYAGPASTKLPFRHVRGSAGYSLKSTRCLYCSPALLNPEQPLALGGWECPRPAMHGLASNAVDPEELALVTGRALIGPASPSIAGPVLAQSALVQSSLLIAALDSINYIFF